MEARKVFLIGGSLFTEALARTLAVADAVEVVGTAPTPEAALPLLVAHCPDAVIVAGTDEASSAAFGQLLTAHPDLPLIRADLTHNDVRVITSRRIGARLPDLLAAIAALPKHT